MRLSYASEKLKKICTDLAAAKRYFGGDPVLGNSLRIRINFLEGAGCLQDVIRLPSLHFHNLRRYKRDLSGLFAIDVKSRKEPWRIILQPLDDDDRPYDPCIIEKIAGITTHVLIEEVSKHYE